MKLITSAFSCLVFYSEIVYCFKLHFDKLSWLLLCWKKRLLSSTHWQLFNHAFLTEVTILADMPKWRGFFLILFHQNYPCQETLISQRLNQLEWFWHNQKSQHAHSYIGHVEDKESRRYTATITFVSFQAARKLSYSRPFWGKEGWRKEEREKIMLWLKISTAKLQFEFITTTSSSEGLLHILWNLH